MAQRLLELLTKIKIMGERITIRKIELIDQQSRMLLQIDIWFEDSEKGGRIFVDTKDFFKLIAKK
jgi:hypothetical protein